MIFSKMQKLRNLVHVNFSKNKVIPLASRKKLKTSFQMPPVGYQSLLPNSMFTAIALLLAINKVLCPPCHQL